LEQLPDPQPDIQPEMSSSFDYSDDAAKEWAQTMLNLDGLIPPLHVIKICEG
jgi:hypothetical protein